MPEQVGEVEVEYQRTYLPLNIYNIMDQCFLAQEHGEDAQIYQDLEGGFNPVQVLYDEDTDMFSVIVNGAEMGDFDNKGEVYDILEQCMAV